MTGVALSSRLTGRPGQAAEQHLIELGRLSFRLGRLEARYLCVDGVEVVRRLFVAIRDVEWGTARNAEDSQEVDLAADTFCATMSALCRDSVHEIEFRWNGSLRGTSEGEVSFAFTGSAVQPFRYGRIGICVLHPPEFAGGTYRARTADGWIEGALAQIISPQLPGAHGFGEPLFAAFDELELRRSDGVGVRLELTGDLFELEDQRNWADASFKTYSTPLALGPQTAVPDREITQQVLLSPLGRAGRGRPLRRGTATIELGSATAASEKLPHVGIGLDVAEDLWSPSTVRLLRVLRPAHLRADLHLGGDWTDRLRQAAVQAELLEASLELAVTAGGDARVLGEFANRLAELEPRLARVLAFREGSVVTSAADVRTLSIALQEAGLSVPVYGGTDGLFADLNGNRPELDGAGGIAFPSVPTVHADDDVSLTETMRIFGEIVRTARTFAAGLPLAVTPISLRERPGVDDRQPSLLGAVWTLGATSALAGAGVESTTFYEATGPRGVLDSGPDGEAIVFPLFHVLADVCASPGAKVVEARSSDPLAVDALAFRAADGGLTVLLANVLPRPTTVELVGFPEGQRRVRRLNHDTYELACRQPEEFRERGDSEAITTIDLAPYEIVRLDGNP